MSVDAIPPPPAAGNVPPVAPPLERAVMTAHAQITLERARGTVHEELLVLAFCSGGDDEPPSCTITTSPTGFRAPLLISISAGISGLDAISLLIAQIADALAASHAKRDTTADDAPQPTSPAVAP